MYNCVTATADSQRLYASSSDGKIKELEEVAGTGMQITREFDTGCAILQLVLPPGEHVPGPDEVILALTADFQFQTGSAHLRHTSLL